jgi:hypothetical protein
VQWYDHIVAALVTLVLSIPAAVMASMAGWWFAIIVSPVAGGLIGGIVHRAIGRRHGRWIWLIVAACIVTGAVMVLIFSFNLISIAIYAVMATGAAAGVLRMGGRR